MANALLAGPALEFARSMTHDTIPEKLRCATCDRLATNAYKLPCCDSTICDSCHSTIDATECPVCMHSPFSADMGAPQKQLRTTVRVFLKTEAKKRGIDLTTGAKLAAETPALESTEPVETPKLHHGTTSAEVQTIATNGAVQPSDSPALDGVPAAAGEPTTILAEVQPDVADLNGDVETKHTDEAQENDDDEDEDDDDDEVIITTERPENEGHQLHDQQMAGEPAGFHESQGPSMEQTMQMQQQGFGFDQNMGGFGNGNFGNMNMNMNGFNPMMGMPGFPMGMPNMMSMSGMGMDPSMVFNGGNFGGMGDMSMMGMGMGGMNGGMNGMGDFGGMGGPPGFFPNQGNYHMQSSYGNAHRQQNFFNDRGFGRGGYGRGFGRGARGNQYGRGRGGWNYQQQHQYGQHQQFAQQQPGGLQQSGFNSTEVTNYRGSPYYETGQGPNIAGEKPQNAEVHDHQDTGCDTNEAGHVSNPTGDATDHITQNSEKAVPSQDSSGAGTGSIVNGNLQAGNGAQNDSVDSAGMQGSLSNEFDNGMQHQQQYGSRNNFVGRGGYRGRGGISFAGGRGIDSTDLTPTPAPPINAPTGPKAMRQGLPNTGWASRAISGDHKSTTTPAPDVKAPTRSVEPIKDIEMKEDGKDQGYRGRSLTRSHSPRRSVKDHERDGDDRYESEETRSRRKERERRKRKEREERYDDDRAASRDADKNSKKYRSRSHSRTDDSSRRRHRDRDDEHRSSRSRRDRSKDRQRRRHRSKSPKRDDSPDDYSRRKGKTYERNTEYEDQKDSHRSRKHSRRDDDKHYDDDRKDRSHRSSKHGRASARDRESGPRPVIEPPSDELGFKIKGSKSARANKDSTAAPTSSRSGDRGTNSHDVAALASSDPYAEERARAQQDREAREAQRRMSTQSSLGKRTRGEGEDENPLDAPRGPKSDRTRAKKSRKERRINYKYEDEVEDDRWR